MKKAYIIISIFIFVSCFGKTNITGKWKIVEPNIGEVYLTFSGSNVVEDFPGISLESGKYIISKGILTRTYDKYTKTDEIISVSSSEMILKPIKIEFSSAEEEKNWYPDGKNRYGSGNTLLKLVKIN